MVVGGGVEGRAEGRAVLVTEVRDDVVGVVVGLEGAPLLILIACSIFAAVLEGLAFGAG